MGYGEDYLTRFDDWYKALDDEQTAEFRSAHPAPLWWHGFYKRYAR